MADDDDDFEFESDLEGNSDEATCAHGPSVGKPSQRLRYRDIFDGWAQTQSTSSVARFLREEAEEHCVVIELHGRELQIYVPQDEESNFFITSDDEDEVLHALLTELNDLPSVRLLPELLRRASDLLGGSRGKTTLPPLVRSTSEQTEEGLVPVPADEFGDESPGHALLATEMLRSKSYKVLDFDGLRSLQTSLVQRVVERHGVGFSEAALLLHRYKWSEEDVSKRLRQNRDAAMVEAGVNLPDVAPKADTEQLCSVCFVDPIDERLACGHGCCSEDWLSFLECNLSSGTVGGQNCLELKCPGDRCPLRVPSHMFERYLEPEDLDRYRRLWVLSFVNDNDQIIWCPASGCELSVAYSKRKSSVTCGCGHTFCFSCKGDAHAPAKCSSAKAWSQKCEEMRGLSTAKNHSEDTKPCPNPDCGVLAHKESGCNYLQCNVCRVFWCWQCGDWGGGVSGRPPPHHVYDCNNPVNQDWHNSAATLNVFDEGRYWWHFDRYKNHKDSHEHALKMRQEMDEAVRQADNRSLAEEGAEAVKVNLSDIKIVLDVAELLVECRLVLVWSYVYAFFEKDDAQRRLFEFVQKDLETRTENLSEKIEKKSIKESIKEVLAQRDWFLDYVAAIRGYLENIKTYTTVDMLVAAPPPMQRPESAGGKRPPKKRRSQQGKGMKKNR